MNIGTWRCWLFGHKFLYPYFDRYVYGIHVVKEFELDHCVRCGIDKPNIEL